MKPDQRLRVATLCLTCGMAIHFASPGNSQTAPPAQTTTSPAAASAAEHQPPESAKPDYELGSDDVIKIWALGMEEISEKPLRIDPAGYIDLPVLGRLAAGGMTVTQLHARLVELLRPHVRTPNVSIDIVEFGSQPVSVMGAVVRPGVQQLRGQKTLAEMLAMAGGLADDAGPVITVTRKKKWGAIPLPNANVSGADFSTAEIKLQDFLSAAKPAENITIFPNDVITIPRAELIYVIGAVRKPGAFPLKQRGSVSILQALSMAEGLGADPAPGSSKILRAQPGTEERLEIPVDVKKVMAGKGTDVGLQANDVLFVPTSTSKQAAKRVLETITRVPIWGF